MREDAKRIVYWFSNIYKMDVPIEKNYTVREGQKSLIGSQKMGEILGHQKIGNVWVDASDGARELETTEDNYSLEDLMKLPGRVNELEKVITDKLIPTIEKQTEASAIHTENIKTHMAVLKEMSETLKEIKKSINTKNNNDN